MKHLIITSLGKFGCKDKDIGTFSIEEKDICYHNIHREVKRIIETICRCTAITININEQSQKPISYWCNFFGESSDKSYFLELILKEV